MARIDDLLEAGLKLLPPKPADTERADIKKRYSERVSETVALAFGEELRKRGLKEARPAGKGDLGDSGAERRMSGGLGAKKVDVTWSTEASGLLCAISIKTINFRDGKTKNFQKNLTNRRGDMLMEAVTCTVGFPTPSLPLFSSSTKTRQTMPLLRGDRHSLMLTVACSSSMGGTTQQHERNSSSGST